jgi:hypothetical protein
MRFKLLASIILLVTGNTIALGQTSAFTYQGKLSDSGNAANSTYDIQFKLFDNATVGAGAQQGPTITNSTVSVTNGIFTVQLDFGASVFTGLPRFLEIGVRPAGNPNPYNLLTPRQPVTATPYAVRSLNASVADTLSSSCVGCVTSTQVGSVSGLVVSGTIPVASVPAGSGNYIQNTTSPHTASFNIGGDGTASGTLSASVVNTATQYNIGGNRVFSTPGPTNVFVGRAAGNTGLGTDNSFFGRNAGLLNTGFSNSFFGSSAGQSNTTGHDNSAFGYLAGTTSTGSNNSFFGRLSGLGDATGDNLTLIGTNASVGSNALSFATAVGAGAKVNDSNSVVLGRAADTVRVPGNLNVSGLLTGKIDATQFNMNGFRVLYAKADTNFFAGQDAGNNFSVGNFTTIVGTDAGFHTNSSEGDTFIGTVAGDSNTTGNYNTTLGSFSDVGSANLTYATAIGSASVVSSSNTIALGRPDGSDLVEFYGRFQMDTLGPASNPLCYNGSNRIGSCSSSLRYKTKVHSFLGGLDIVRRLRPISFNWKEDGQADLGLGAEEVARVEPRLTFRNKQGEIEGVKYNQLSAVLVNAVKEQQAQLAAQQQTIEQLQHQLDVLKAALPRAWRTPPIYDEATQAQVKLAGTAALEVTFAFNYGEKIDIYEGYPKERLNLPVLLEIKQIDSTEGVMSFALGLQGRHAFRIQTLTNPARLVVDIKH